MKTAKRGWFRISTEIWNEIQNGTNKPLQKSFEESFTSINTQKIDEHTIKCEADSKLFDDYKEYEITATNENDIITLEAQPI